MSRVTFIVRGLEGDVASSRYRVFQYLKYFKKNKIKYSVIAPPRRKIVHFLGWIPFVVKLILFGFISKTIFIQKDIISLYFWKIFKFFKKKIIYDFDDAIFQEDSSGEQPFFSFGTFTSRKFNGNLLEKMICMADLVMVANKYLEEHAKKFSKKTIVLPMSINIEKYKTKQISEDYPVVIGWIGSPSTTIYLSLIQETLARIKSIYSEKVKIKIVTNGKIPLTNFEYQHVPWSHSTEKGDILSFDIGLVPLPNDPWTKGKSSFKLLQFMACGLPTVCSTVGFNEEVIINGKNGFLAKDTEEWIIKLSKLIDDPLLRHRLGSEARITVESYYSLSINAEILARSIMNV